MIPHKDPAKKTSTGKSLPRPFPIPKGMNDVLPGAEPWWRKIRKHVEDLASFYHFHRVITPLVESEDLFLKAYRMEGGDATLFSGVKIGGGKWVIRTEGRIPILRAYFEHGIGRQSQPQRLWYEGEMCATGVSRENTRHVHHEAGFEIIGGQNDPLYDAQAMLVCANLVKALKIPGVMLKVNSMGCRVCRPLYKKQLQFYYGHSEKVLCRDCTKHLKTSPFRLLSCTKEACASLRAAAPNILDRICAPCTTHFKRTLEYLEELKVDYALDHSLLGETDYWNRAIFGIFAEGFPSALARGGRYDYLAEAIGGRPTPAVGGSVIYETLVEAMHAKEAKLGGKHVKKVFVIHVGDLAKRKAMKLVEDLKAFGIPVGESFGKESLKAQLKIAEKEGYGIVLILGQREIYEESVILRDLESSTQETIPLSRLEEEIKKRTKKA